MNTNIQFLMIAPEKGTTGFTSGYFVVSAIAGVVANCTVARFFCLTRKNHY